MKKLRMCILVLVSALLVESLVFASDVIPYDTVGQEVSDGEKAFTIDDKNIYKDMDKAYKDGYQPIISEGVATIILPLYTDDELKIASIKATPDLGNTDTSPFVFKNYQKTFRKTMEKINGTSEEREIFLVRFDLKLRDTRKNGAYPVVISVNYTYKSRPISQLFTAYVRITDEQENSQGEKEPELPPVDEPIVPPVEAPVESGGGTEDEEKPTSEPKVIVAKCIDLPEKIEAGDEFAFKAILKNTSQIKSVQNMTVSVSIEAKEIALQADSNVFYFERLGTGSTLEVPLKFKVDEKTEVGKYPIILEMSYDNPKAVSLTSSSKIEINVRQKMQMEMELGNFSAEINAGDSMSVPIQAINFGRSKIYNVHCSVDVPGLKADKSLFLGNMEGGSALSGEMNVFAGMVDEKAKADDRRYGKTSGKIILTYEDESGEEYTVSKDMSLTINPLAVKASKDSGNDKEKTIGTQIMVGGAVLLAFILAGAAIPLVKRIRNRRKIYEED